MPDGKIKMVHNADFFLIETTRMLIRHTDQLTFHVFNLQIIYPFYMFLNPY